MNKTLEFDAERADSYDQRFQRLAPMKDCLHLIARQVLSPLPDDARLLIVGAGTGAELLYLAEAFPGFSFVAVDPAAPMLDKARARADGAGVGDRCRFIEGTTADVGERGFHAATSLLVSHFLVDRSVRTAFFRSIAERLAPGGLLLTADLSGDEETAAGRAQVDLWWRTSRYAGLPEDEVERMRAVWGKELAVLPPSEVEALIAAGGFSAPTPVFQSILMRAWMTTRA